MIDPTSEIVNLGITTHDYDPQKRTRFFPSDMPIKERLQIKVWWWGWHEGCSKKIGTHAYMVLWRQRLVLIWLTQSHISCVVYRLYQKYHWTCCSTPEKLDIDYTLSLVPNRTCTFQSFASHYIIKSFHLRCLIPYSSFFIPHSNFSLFNFPFSFPVFSFSVNESPFPILNSRYFRFPFSIFFWFSLPNSAILFSRFSIRYFSSISNASFPLLNILLSITLYSDSDHRFIISESHFSLPYSLKSEFFFIFSSIFFFNSSPPMISRSLFVIIIHPFCVEDFR